jgi:hypothetical protein
MTGTPNKYSKCLHHLNPVLQRQLIPPPIKPRKYSYPHHLYPTTSTNDANAGTVAIASLKPQQWLSFHYHRTRSRPTPLILHHSLVPVERIALGRVVRNPQEPWAPGKTSMILEPKALRYRIILFHIYSISKKRRRLRGYPG